MSAEKCDPGMKSYPRRPLSITPLIGRPGHAADPPRHTRDKARSAPPASYVIITGVLSWRAGPADHALADVTSPISCLL